MRDCGAAYGRVWPNEWPNGHDRNAFRVYPARLSGAVALAGDRPLDGPSQGLRPRACEIVGLSSRATPATRALERARLPVRTHTYAHNPRHGSYGREAAEALGLDPATVYKTLIADVDGKLTVAIVPVERQLDLKALAAAVNGKRAQIADVKQAERTTGYIAGGISPLGQKRPLPTVIDDSAPRHEAIYVSGGRRGLEIELAPADLIRLTNAAVAPISR